MKQFNDAQTSLHLRKQWGFYLKAPSFMMGHSVSLKSWPLKQRALEISPVKLWDYSLTGTIHLKTALPATLVILSAILYYPKQAYLDNMAKFSHQSWNGADVVVLEAQGVTKCFCILCEHICHHKTFVLLRAEQFNQLGCQCFDLFCFGECENFLFSTFQYLRVEWSSVSERGRDWRKAMLECQ